MMNPRHTILLITYRQASTIEACLDSIFSQSVAPYEVVIADDCSPDNTWDIIQHYASKFPTIIKAIRHPQNLGVFGNFNELIKCVSGDFVNIVAGDDLLPQGILEKYNYFIEKHHLNCNDSFVIYTNSLVLKPDGEMIFKNNKINFKEDMFEAGVEQGMWSWDTGMSAGLMRRMQEGIRTDLGYQADLLWHLKKAVNSDNSYFMDEIGYIYRANVGVSVGTKYQKHLESKRLVVAEIMRQFPDRITPKVKRYFEFDDSWMLYNAQPSFRTYCNFVKHYFNYGRFPQGNIHHNPFKVLLPMWAKNIIKKLIRRSY